MKKLSITLLLSLMMVGLSSCDKHFWSVLSGHRWYAVEAVEGYTSYPIYTTDYDYMEITFHTNGTGNISYYDYGYWNTYGFEWGRSWQLCSPLLLWWRARIVLLRHSWWLSVSVKKSLHGQLHRLQLLMVLGK